MNEKIISQMQQNMDAWSKFAEEQARAAIDEAARLAKETIAYAAQLQAEWRKLALPRV